MYKNLWKKEKEKAWNIAVENIKGISDIFREDTFEIGANIAGETKAFLNDEEDEINIYDGGKFICTVKKDSELLLLFSGLFSKEL